MADVVDVEYGENAPIIGGAAGDGVEDPQPDSAASRAATTTLPRPEPKRIDPADRAPANRQGNRRRRRRTLLSVVLLFALLVGVAAAGSAWVLSQYFVGATDDGEVVIFQGVRGEVLGLPLHTRAEDSCPDSQRSCEAIFLNDLRQSAQVDVERGVISNAGLPRARDIIAGLRAEHLLPLCPATHSAADTSRLPTAPAPTPSEQPSRTTAPTAGGLSPVGQAGAPGSGRPDAPSSAPTITGTPLPERPSKPGVDCRTAR